MFGKIPLLSRRRASEGGRTVSGSRCGAFDLLPLSSQANLYARWKDLRMKILIGVALAILCVVIIVPVVTA
jgi:hypothetical protein